MTFLNDFFPQETQQGAWDWSKPSRAVVANFDGDGLVLWAVGGHINFEIEAAGSRLLCHLGMYGAPEGISVWEGVAKSVRTNTPDCDEWDSWLEGDFREPTEKEWMLIRKNECPWDHSEWRPAVGT